MKLNLAMRRHIKPGSSGRLSRKAISCLPPSDVQFAMVGQDFDVDLGMAHPQVLQGRDHEPCNEDFRGGHTHQVCGGKVLAGGAALHIDRRSPGTTEAGRVVQFGNEIDPAV